MVAGGVIISGEVMVISFLVAWKDKNVGTFLIDRNLRRYLFIWQLIPKEPVLASFYVFMFLNH